MHLGFTGPAPQAQPQAAVEPPAAPPQAVPPDYGVMLHSVHCALDGPVDDDLARWLGKSRQELYAAAGEKGIDGRMDMRKRELLEALAAKA